MQTTHLVVDQLAPVKILCGFQKLLLVKMRIVLPLLDQSENGLKKWLSTKGGWGKGAGICFAINIMVLVYQLLSSHDQEHVLVI